MPPYYEDPSAFPLQGGCVCGQIRYSMKQAPMVVHCCHCTSCQLETGTAFAINAIIEMSSLEQLPAAKPMVPCGPGGGERALALPELLAASSFVPEQSILSSTTTAATAAAATTTIDDAPLPYSAPPRAEGATDALTLRYVTLPSESGHGHTAALCPRCATCVWTYYGMGPLVGFVRAGTLDEPWRMDPDVHIFTRSKRAFIEITDGKPVFEEYYPDRTAFWRPESVERFTVLVPKIKEYLALLRKAKM